MAYLWYNKILVFELIINKNKMPQTNSLPADQPDEEPSETPHLDDAEKNAAEFFRRVRLAKDEGLIHPNQVEATFKDLLEQGEIAVRAEHGRKHDMVNAEVKKTQETSAKTKLELFLQTVSAANPDELGAKLRVFCTKELGKIMYPGKGAVIPGGVLQELAQLGALKIFDFGEDHDKIAVVLKKNGVWIYKEIRDGKWAAQGI